MNSIFVIILIILFVFCAVVTFTYLFTCFSTTWRSFKNWTCDDNKIIENVILICNDVRATKVKQDGMILFNMSYFNKKSNKTEFIHIVMPSDKHKDGPFRVILENHQVNIKSPDGMNSDISVSGTLEFEPDLDQNMMKSIDEHPEFEDAIINLLHVRHLWSF